MKLNEINHFNESQAKLLTRQEHLFMINASEQAQRYQQMAEFMKRFIFWIEQSTECPQQPIVFQKQERKLFHVAHKNIISDVLYTWRQLTSLIRLRRNSKEKIQPNPVETSLVYINKKYSSINLININTNTNNKFHDKDRQLQLLKQYKLELQQKLKQHYQQVTQIIDKYFFRLKQNQSIQIRANSFQSSQASFFQSKKVQSFIYFLKIKADQYRHLCQITQTVLESTNLKSNQTKNYSNQGWKYKQKQNEKNIRQSNQFKQYLKYQKLCSSHYQLALQMSQIYLKSINPLRMQVVLKYSSFLYQIKKDLHKGNELGRREFEQCIEDPDFIQINQQEYRDMCMVFSILRDNLQYNQNLCLEVKKTEQ